MFKVILRSLFLTYFLIVNSLVSTGPVFAQNSTSGTDIPVLRTQNQCSALASCAARQDYNTVFWLCQGNIHAAADAYCARFIGLSGNNKEFFDCRVNFRPGSAALSIASNCPLLRKQCDSDLEQRCTERDTTRDDVGKLQREVEQLRDDLSGRNLIMDHIIPLGGAFIATATGIYTSIAACGASVVATVLSGGLLAPSVLTCIGAVGATGIAAFALVHWAIELNDAISDYREKSNALRDMQDKLDGLDNSLSSGQCEEVRLNCS